MIRVKALLAAAVVVPRDTPSATVAEEPAAPRSLPSGVRWLAVYAFLMGSGVAAVNAYLPLYLVERGGASQEQAGVVVSPGSSYGPNGEGYVRMSLTLPDDRLREAVSRIEQHLRVG